MVYCEQHRENVEEIRETKKLYSDLSDGVSDMLGKMDELLDEMRQTRVTTAVAQERMNNHIQNMFVHLNKWYASAVIIGGILAAVLLKVGGH
jgi:hypothetical protein